MKQHHHYHATLKSLTQLINRISSIQEMRFGMMFEIESVSTSKLLNIFRVECVNRHSLLSARNGQLK